MAGKVKLDPASVLPPLFSASKDHFVTFKFLLWPPHYVETEDLLIGTKVSPWIPPKCPLGFLCYIPQWVNSGSSLLRPSSPLPGLRAGIAAQLGTNRRGGKFSVCRPLTCGQ